MLGEALSVVALHVLALHLVTNSPACGTAASNATSHAYRPQLLQRSV
jgi:hypothetical protein